MPDADVTPNILNDVAVHFDRLSAKHILSVSHVPVTDPDPYVSVSELVPSTKLLLEDVANFSPGH